MTLRATVEKIKVREYARGDTGQMCGVGDACMYRGMPLERAPVGAEPAVAAMQLTTARFCT